MTATFFASPRAIVYDCRRRHSRRPEACCWWRRRPRWIWFQEEHNSAAPRSFDIDLRLRFGRFGRSQPITGLHSATFFSDRKFNISCPAYIKNHFWPSFLQFFTNGGHFRTPTIAWRYASDMTSPRRHRSDLGSALRLRIAPTGIMFLLCFFFHMHSERLWASDYSHEDMSFRRGGGSVTSVPRIPASLHPFDTAFLWHFPFRLSVSWQVHSAIHIWPPSQYIVVLYLVVLFYTPTWLDSILVLT